MNDLTILGLQHGTLIALGIVGGLLLAYGVRQIAQRSAKRAAQPLADTQPGAAQPNFLDTGACVYCGIDLHHYAGISAVGPIGSGTTQEEAYRSWRAMQ